MKHWKIILALLAIALLSAYGGGIVGYRVAKDQARRRSNPEAWNVTAMRVLESRLKLTPAQIGKVQAAVEHCRHTRRPFRVREQLAASSRRRRPDAAVLSR